MEASQHPLFNPIRALLPHDVTLAGGPLDSFQDPLPSEEAAYARNVSLKRKREFTAGRNCARQALKSISARPGSILFDDDRLPQWPKGATACISHSKTLVIAIAARCDHYPRLGIDLESAERVTQKLWKTLFHSDEIHFLQTRTAEDQARWATVLFSAKETYFKFQFPETRAWLSFHDITLSPIGSQLLAVQPKRTGLPLPQKLFYAPCGDHIVTVAI